MICDCCHRFRGEYRLRLSLVVVTPEGVNIMRDGSFICYRCYHFSDVWREEPCGPSA